MDLSVRRWRRLPLMMDVVEEVKIKNEIVSDLDAFFGPPFFPGLMPSNAPAMPTVPVRIGSVVRSDCSPTLTTFRDD